MVMPRGGGEQPPRKPQGIQSSSTSSGSKQGGNQNVASSDAVRRARAMDNRRPVAGRGSSPPNRGGERPGGRHQPTSSPSPNQQSSHTQQQQKQAQRRSSPHTMPPQHSRASPSRFSRTPSPVKTSDLGVMIKRTIFNPTNKSDRNLPTVQSSTYRRTRSRSPQEHFDVSHQQALLPERKSREIVPPSALQSGYSEYQKRPTVASSSYAERHTFRGPDTPVILDAEKTLKMTVGISKNVAEILHIRPEHNPRTELTNNPQDFILNRREGEGTQPMFDRPDIKMAIKHRIQRETEEGKLLNMVEKLQATSAVTHTEVASNLRPGEQRVVAVIREPILVPTEIRPRYRESDRYYEEDERRERERRGDSRDRHYSSRYSHRDSPPRHYDSRHHDDLRLDLDLRRRESERSRGGRSRSRDRERERERDHEYYRRHSASYRDYRDRDRERDRERERERERDREREMRDREHRHHRGEHERRRSPRDYRDGHRSYRRTPPPSHRSEGYPPRPSGENRSGGFAPPPSTSSKPSPNQQPPNNGAAPSSAPPVNFDPEYVPKGRAYFEHDNRDTFVPMGRGRGGFPPNFNPRGGFMPPRGFMPRGGMRGRGGYPPGPPGPPPFSRGRPPFFGPRGAPRGGFPRTKRRSPDWKHDLFEANDHDQRPSSTTK